MPAFPGYEWDTVKSALNRRKHGLPLEAAVHFDFSSALIRVDDREDYGEPRYNAYGLDAEGRVMALCFTPRGRNIRFISYRKASRAEREEFLDSLGIGKPHPHQ